MVPISGIVSIDGKPLDQGEVMVWVIGSRPALGSIGKDGRYKLVTYGKGDGCVQGEFTVTVQSAKSGPRGSGDTMLYLIPQKYEDPKLSKLKVKIEEPTDSLNIDLTWKGESHNGPYIVR